MASKDRGEAVCMRNVLYSELTFTLHRTATRWCQTFTTWSRTERELRRSEESGMLIGDPLGEGSNASSTDNELWRAENSFLRMRGN